MKAPPKAARHGLLSRLSRGIDAAWLAIAPERGLRRLAYRRAAELLAERPARRSDDRAAQNRGLETTSPNDSRAERWMASRLSVQDILAEDLEAARHNSRELYRSDGIGGSVDSRVNHVVGATFTVQARVPDRDELNREIEAALEDWMIRVDVDGTRSLWQTLRLIERCHAVDGEAFVVLSDLGSADKPIPLAVEVIDADRVMTPPERANDPNIRLGIERDSKKRIVAYWIRNESPFDSLTRDVGYQRVAASRVLHLFEPWFAEATRGLPWMVRVQNRVKDIQDLDEANLIAMQVEASFAAFIETSGGNPFDQAVAAASGATAEGNRLEQIIPGLIQRMPKGDKIHFANPNRSGGNYGASLKLNYHRVAAGMNEPYEMLMKDWEGVSFAGGRIILAEKKISSGVFRRLLIERILMPLYWRALDELVIVGAIGLDPREYNRRLSFYRRHHWMGPGWEYAINPVDEIRADKEAVEANFKTRAQVVAERSGQDVEVIDRERQRERQRERDYDIVPPSLAEADALPSTESTAADATATDPALQESAA